MRQDGMQRLFASGFLAAVLVLACSSSSSDPAGSSNQSQPVPTFSPDPGTFDGGKTDSGGQLSCATARYATVKAPLALQVMLDRSDSMLGVTGSGRTKWEDARTALGTFLSASGPALQVGLSYFPQRAAGVPASCSFNAQCGAAGPCGQHFCLQPGAPIACESSEDCNVGKPCVPVGKCSIADKLCVATAADPCGAGGGTCVLSCQRETACEVADYATSRVPMQSAPAAKSAILAALAATTPWGGTPTGPALGGALTSAGSFADTHADHVPAVALVTDGMATDCSITDAADLAQLADLGWKKHGVRTFVIGIFSASEESAARPTLNAIAAAGGTDSAHIILESADVGAEVAAALERVRTRAVPCAYALPEVPNGQTVDLGRINVTVKAGSAAAATVPKVASASDCGTSAGWYYEAGSARISLCSSSCDAVTAPGAAAQVDIVTGCVTVVR